MHHASQPVYLMCRVALTLANLWARANVFNQFHFHCLGEDMPHVLLRMVRSGHFYPAGNWVIPCQGRGMVRRRADACWKMLTDPEHVSMRDVGAVFFEDCRERYYTDVTTLPSYDGDSDDGTATVVSPSVAKVFYAAAQRRAVRAANTSCLVRTTARPACVCMIS